MKTFLAWIVSGFVAGLSLFILAMSVPIFKRSSFFHWGLERAVTRECHCEFKIEKVLWKWDRPLRIEMQGLHFAKDTWDGDLKDFQAEVRILNWPFSRQTVPWASGLIVANGLSMNGTVSPTSEGSKAPPPPPDWNGIFEKLSWSSGVDLEVELSQLKTQIQYPIPSRIFSSIRNELNKGKISFRGIQRQLTWDLDLIVHSPIESMPLPVPIQFQGRITETKKQLILDHTLLKVLALPISMKGQFGYGAPAGAGLGQQSFEAQITMEKTDLAQVGIPILDSILKSWSGQVSGDIQLTKRNSAEPWQAQFKMELQNFKLELNKEKLNEAIQRAPLGFRVEGSIAIPELAVQGLYHDIKGLSLSMVKWNVNGQDLAIERPEIFKKEASYPLNSMGQASWNPTINIEKSRSQLGPAVLSLEGTIRDFESVDLQFQVSPFSLDGFERLILPLKDSPMTGRVSVKGHVAGAAKNPDTFEINLEQAVLENVRTHLKWSSPDLHVEGPVAVQFKGQLSSKGASVSQGRAEIQVDLSALGINKKDPTTKKDLFIKRPREALALRVAAEARDGALKIKTGRLLGAFGSVDLQGPLPLPPLYQSDLTISSKAFQLTPLKDWIPSLAEVLPAGAVDVDLNLKGRWDLKNILESPIDTRGRVFARIPSYTLKSKEGAPVVANPTPMDPPTSLLPSQALFKNMQIKLEAQLGEFRWKEMKAKDLRLSAEKAKEELQGTLSIGNLFGGTLLLPNFKVSAFKVDPEVAFEAKIKDVDLGQGLRVFLPPFKDFISGTFNGQFSGRSRLPHSPYFLPALYSRGLFQIDKAELKFQSLEIPLKEALAPLGAAQREFNQLHFKNSDLTMKSEFNLDQQKIILNPLNVVFDQGQELLLKGQLGFNLGIQAEGTLALGRVLSGGSFYEANKDEQGRLVLPLQFSGTLRKPDTRILQEAVAKMIQKTIEYEKLKATQQIQNDINAKVKKETQNFQKDLQKKAEIELKKLFGR